MNPLQKKYLVLPAVAVVVFAAVAGAIWWLTWRPVAYVNAQEGYSIRFPAGWDVHPSETPSYVYAEGFLGPNDGEAGGVISIIVADIQSLPNEGRGVAWWSPLAATRFEGFARLREGNWRLARQDVPWIEFSYLREKNLTQGRQFYLRNGTRGYVVLCFAAPAAFEKFRTDFDRTIRSFRFE
ncbi:MAG TPA: hypothetical protein VGK61_08305 [Planctomycetota bacterium]|jgi:hypothetical protein